MDKERDVRETLDILLEMATLLNTGLDRDTLALCVSMIERGVNPEALAAVLKELKNEQQQQQQGTRYSSPQTFK